MRAKRVTTIISKKDVVEKRRSLFSNSEKRVVFKKGDHRVNTPRICVVCSRPLSSLILRENTYITIQSHIRFHLNNLFKVDICEDVHSCYRTLKQKGELE
ncbi:hypothetical protein Goe7_c00480 [Bacillus phage vB_BveM-Goe7]|uniref:Uncharacterized protein n=1 Tax=Bacillus phage vB_BsuM-Goe3 TaxID=1933063 RepID=A0A217ER13_BPGO3|nr:hypothetical protein HWB07_gp048 [Bacillus phage vB_BsuM-Goe3]APZ82514.1 hypothetical protein Goe3_c04800 [Bacillus phage vB_BsuM-Goe3]QDP43078.1 hypothetical protein Goe7_c00480 [Bacillus phage vB_BveM-Goe7]